MLVSYPWKFGLSAIFLITTATSAFATPQQMDCIANNPKAPIIFSVIYDEASGNVTHIEHYVTGKTQTYATEATFSDSEINYEFTDVFHLTERVSINRKTLGLTFFIDIPKKPYKTDGSCK